MSRDAIIIEYRNTYAQMKGISPKLSSYAQLEKKLQELSFRLGDQKPDLGNVFKNRYNKLIDFKKISITKEVLVKKLICNIPGCGLPRKKKGSKDLRSLCSKHYKEKRAK